MILRIRKLMISEEVKDYAWSELLELDKHVRYYGELASRNQRKHSILQFAVFFLSMALPAVASIYSPPLGVVLIAALGTAACVAWDYMSGHASKAALLHGISVDCERLEVEQRELFHTINRDGIDESDAREKLAGLASRTIETVSRAGTARVIVDETLNAKCWEAANRVLMNTRQEPLNA